MDLFTGPHENNQSSTTKKKKISPNFISTGYTDTLKCDGDFIYSKGRRGVETVVYRKTVVTFKIL